MQSRYQALIAEVVSGVSSDSLLCRPLNQAIDTLKKVGRHIHVIDALRYIEVIRLTVLFSAPRLL
jgi:hypothetical protein